MQAIPEDAVQEDSGDEEEEEDVNKRISSKNLSLQPNAHLESILPITFFEKVVCHVLIQPFPAVDVQSALMTRG